MESAKGDCDGMFGINLARYRLCKVYGSSDMDLVIVTLQARNAMFDEIDTRRQIILTSQNPSLRIGRASKVHTKGFVAANDNAWFESPVMSREHAELTASFAEKVCNPSSASIELIRKMELTYEHQTVFVKDIGSLHGTFLKHSNTAKEEKLLARKQIRLEQDDSLRFGIDIIRHHESFPPYIVDVKMEWTES
jgi:frataxin-like iron-binding protein CyaY